MVVGSASGPPTGTSSVMVIARVSSDHFSLNFRVPSLDSSSVSASFFATKASAKSVHAGISLSSYGLSSVSVRRVFHTPGGIPGNLFCVMCWWLGWGWLVVSFAVSTQILKPKE